MARVVTGGKSQKGLVPDEADFTSPADVPSFWETRPVLTHIRDLALSRVISPWGLLGYDLALVSATTDHTILIPGEGESRSVLNMFVALVGPTGAGKGETQKAAHQMVAYDPDLLARMGPGTGEGFLAGYVDAGAKGVTQHHYNALITAPEVTTLNKIIERPGSTVEGIICSAWAGEQLAFATSDKTKRRAVESFTYRMGMVLGVQPAKAGPFIRGVDQGLVQRFLWLPVREPQNEIPPAPEPLVIEPPAMRVLMNEDMDMDPMHLQVMTVADSILDEIRAERMVRTHESLLESNPNSHRMQQRLRVAGNLAIIDGRADKVTVEDWELAGTVMNVSDYYREMVLQAVRDADRKVNQAAGRHEADRITSRDAKLRQDREAAVERVADVILRKAGKQGGSLSNRDITQAIRSSDRHLKEEAVEHLLGTRQLRRRGSRYEVAGGDAE
jgi:hypothetical protein